MEERRKDYPDFLSRLCRIEEKVINIEKRVNGTFETIGEHIRESDQYRNIIIRNEISVRWITIIFTSVNIAIFVALLKLYIK